MLDDELIDDNNDSTIDQHQQDERAKRTSGERMAFASIKASAKGGKDFEPVPQGVHLAICVNVIDLGWQPQTGKYPKPKRQVYFKFEIPDVQVSWSKDGEDKTGPATIGRKFGLSLSDKSHLKPFLVSWRGKPFTSDELEAFDVTSVIGKICQLSVVHEEGEVDGRKKIFARISGAFPLVKEQKEALAKNPARSKPSTDLLVYSPEAHDQDIYDALPEWMQEAIDKRVEDPNATDAASTSQAPTKNAEDFDDDIPF